MQVLVIGAGNFGATVAVELAEKGCEVIVVDHDAEKLEDIRDRVSQAIVGDGTDRDLLEKFAHDIDLVVVSLGETVDSSVLATHRLKELGVKRIIAKATSEDHGEILKIIGAHQVVFPERDEAKRLVFGVMAPNAVDLLQISSEFNMVEVAVPEQFYGKTVQELDLRNKYGLYVLAVRNPLDGKVHVPVIPAYAFRADDTMIVIGDISAVEKLRG